MSERVMYGIAAFVIDFELNTIADAEALLEAHEAVYVLSGTAENRLLPGSASKYNLAHIRAFVKKLKKLPKRSASGDSWETLIHKHIPKVYLYRAIGISDYEAISSPSIEGAEIDVAAEKLGISRAELVKKAVKLYKLSGRPTLSAKLIMYAHSTLQRVVCELERLGFEGAEYVFYCTDSAYQGSFGVGASGNRIFSLIRGGALPALPDAIPWIRGGDGEYDILFDPDGHTEGEVIAALRALSDWTKALRRVRQVQP